MSSNRKLTVEIVGNSKSLEQAFNKSGKEADGFGHSLDKVGKIAAVVAGAAGLGMLAEGLKKSVDASMEAQVDQSRLNTALKATHQSIKKMTPAIEEAEGRSRKLGFADNETTLALAKLEVATKNTHKATADLAVAENISRLKKIDLQSATQMLTGSMAGNTRAAKGLGIILMPVTAHMDALKEKYKALGKAIPVAEKHQAQMLDKMATGQSAIQQVTDKVKGQAKAYADTAAGGMAQFSAQISHLEIVIGDDLLPVLTRTVRTIVQNWPTISMVVKAVATAVGVAMHTVVIPALKLLIQAGQEAVAWTRAHWPEISRIAAKALADLKWAVDNIAKPALKDLQVAVAFVADWVRAHWDKIRADTLTVFAAIKTIVQDAITVVRGVITVGTAVIEAVWSRFGSNILQALKTTWNLVKGTIQNALQVIRGVVNIFAGLVHGDWSRLWEGVKQVFGGVFNEIVLLLKSEIASMLNILSVAVKGFTTAASAVGHAIVGGIKAAVSGIAGWIKHNEIDPILGFFRGLPAGIGNAVASGADEGKKLLLDAMHKVFSVLPGFVRDALGIHSPSRVFADIGHNIIMGAVHGIEKAGPKLLSAARDKFSKLAQVGGPAGVGVSTGGLVPQVERALFYARNMGWNGVVTSGWRSYSQQAALYARYLAGGPLAAPPGHSSHETGQAVDVTDYGTFGRIMETAPGFERLYNRLGGLDPVHFSVSGFAKGGIVTKPTLAMIGEAGQNEAVIPLGESGVDISELGAQRIADAADRTTWARSPEVHVSELAQVLGGLALPITVMTLSDAAVGQMTGAVQGAADAIGAAVSSAIGPYLGGGGGGGDGGGGGGGGSGFGSGGEGPPKTGGEPVFGHHPGTLPGTLPINPHGGTGGPTGEPVLGHPREGAGGVQTIHLQLDSKTVASVVRGADSKYRQVNG